MDVDAEDEEEGDFEASPLLALSQMTDKALSLELVTPSHPDILPFLQDTINRRAKDAGVTPDDFTAKLLTNWKSGGHTYRAVVVLADPEGLYHYVSSETDELRVAQDFVNSFQGVASLANGNKVVRVVIYPAKRRWQEY